MKVELSEEMANFVKQLANTIETQDTRGTRNPIYFCVRRFIDQTLPDECTDEKMYHDYSACENYTEEELRYWCEENGYDFDEYVEEHCTRYSIREAEEYEGFFLTEKGYEQHVKLDGHNISRRCNKKGFDSYVQHVYCNPEMETVIKLILEIGKQLNK